MAKLPFVAGGFARRSSASSSRRFDLIVASDAEVRDAAYNALVRLARVRDAAEA